MRRLRDVDEAMIVCAECERSVDEFTAIAEQWGFWSDGVGGLVPYCRECAKREFASDASSEHASVSRPSSP